MTTTLRCTTCQTDGPPITGRIPFREPLKGTIQQRVCATCWAGWRDQQLKIINEYRLNLGDDSARALLEQAVGDFLRLSGDGDASVPVTGPEKARELGNL
jgi:Fe-S cluster biosynthesis and repair protein YggX